MYSRFGALLTLEPDTARVLHHKKVVVQNGRRELDVKEHGASHPKILRPNHRDSYYDACSLEAARRLVDVEGVDDDLNRRAALQ